MSPKVNKSYPGRDPAQTFRFYVEIDGVYTGEFLECGGLSLERETKLYEEGGQNEFVHQLPGRVKQGNITLKRGITDRYMWAWFCQGLHDGCVLRKNISIVLGNAELLKVRQWDVRKAFPVKWSGATLNTTSQEVAAETLELAHQGITLNAVENQPLTGG